MRNVTIERTLAASKAAVWGVLADFANIADWNDGVSASYATNDVVDGVGAKRHCDLAPMGTLEETVQEWEPEARMVISIDSVTRLPIKRGLMTFSLNEGGSESATPFTLNYDFEPGGGILSFITGPLLQRQLAKGFAGFLDNLESAAQTRQAS